MFFGDWEMRHHRDLQREDAQNYAAWCADWQHAAPTNGESFQRFARRVSEFIPTLTDCRHLDHLLIVGHQGVLSLLTALLLQMPAAAMWLQCLLVGVFIVLVSFGGDSASAFYNKLTLMANVSMTLPYLFLTIAFPFFKAKTHLDRPFVIFKNRPSTLLATGVVLLVVTFANIFTIIQPVIDSGDWNSTLWMVGGPIFFSLLALGIYESYRRRMASGALVMES